MPPDFGKQVIEVLAKRAALMCSNVECQAITSGPADDPQKSVNIGEAAHIYGAKEGAARFREDMTDAARAEITNGIWLCRNCHKLVDADPKRFPAELLFQWRAAHERHVISKLGTTNDLLRLDIELRDVDKFLEDSPLAAQIVRDRPPGWEYRLTSELLKSYLKANLRNWSDLRNGLYSKATIMIESGRALTWFGAKVQESGRLVDALGLLYSRELQKAWGMPGEPGDPLEIRHVCRLIRSAVDEILKWEESVRFIAAEEPYTKLSDSLSGALGTQIDQIASVPHFLDEAVDWLDTNPDIHREFHFQLTFKLPEGWIERLEADLEEITRRVRTGD